MTPSTLREDDELSGMGDLGDNGRDASPVPSLAVTEGDFGGHLPDPETQRSTLQR